jgi:hypothetical protein
MSGNADAARLRVLARLSRTDARRSTNPETKQLLLEKAADYERQADLLDHSEG